LRRKKRDAALQSSAIGRYALRFAPCPHAFSRSNAGAKQVLTGRQVPSLGIATLDGEPFLLHAKLLPLRAGVAKTGIALSIFPGPNQMVSQIFELVTDM
jgi:hypothetical protein